MLKVRSFMSLSCRFGIIFKLNFVFIGYILCRTVFKMNNISKVGVIECLNAGDHLSDEKLLDTSDNESKIVTASVNLI